MEQVLILDFGSQVTQLIARRLRESGVYCEIWPYTADPLRIAEWRPNGIIFSGGPASVHTEYAPHAPQEVFSLGIPILGICYGEQLLCQQLGGKVEASDHREFGQAFIEIVDDCALFDDIWSSGSRQTVWMSHGDRVTRLPEGFRVVAVSDGAPFAAIADDVRRFYGVQFHPEVTHTPMGAALLRNFTHGVLGLSGTWNMDDFHAIEIARIRTTVGPRTVVCGLSGGVDSTVAAVLIHEAIGEQLTCIFVDHGLLRQGEAEEVITTFRDRFNIRLVHRDASKLFLDALTGVTDSEAKRKIIGRLFIEVFDEESRKLGGMEYLAQGTLYPDVIESASLTGTVIKSHHNVGGLPDRMRMKLIEPLRALFKDEVRVLGRRLKIPELIVGRHPFPGPGLAIRIPGAITPEKVRILQSADAIYLEEIRAAGLYDAIWQAFAVLIEVRCVDGSGSIEQTIVLRAVSSTDGMTADVFPFNSDFLMKVKKRILSETDVDSVVYDQTSKPPGTIEWE